MSVKFYVAPWRTDFIPTPNSVYLRADSWDDFGYKTTFKVHFYDVSEKFHDFGEVKIAKRGQRSGWTSELLPTNFISLSDDFFSLGQDRDYYSSIRDVFGVDGARNFLACLNDVVENASIRGQINSEIAFGTSLTRFISYATIGEQFERIVSGGAALTKYDFAFNRESSEGVQELRLNFKVEPLSLPATNVHVIIGRNGVGKTTLLNGMIDAAIGAEPRTIESKGFFQKREESSSHEPMSIGYFSAVVSVSFSAFDPFDPPGNSSERCDFSPYTYIGLKSVGGGLKSLDLLNDEFVDSLVACLSNSFRRARWLSSIQTLSVDHNFDAMNLDSLASIDVMERLRERAAFLFGKMSSGHAIVLLTITRLVQAVEEKTLVIIDEPESHLHPPLLSAFMRALSELLTERNGVAIVATHSPVVVQEVPKSCAWKIWRSRDVAKAERPEVETFGENLGVLTREIFGLEVANSGFHGVLASIAKDEAEYDRALDKFDGKIGVEGRAILRAMIISRASE